MWVLPVLIDWQVSGGSKFLFSRILETVYFLVFICSWLVVFSMQTLQWPYFFFSLTEYTCYGFFGSVVTIFPLINNRNKKSLISHLPIDGLTVPEQQPPDSFPLSYILSMTPYGLEYLFGQAGSAVPASCACQPPQCGWGEKLKNPWLGVSPTWQQLKHQWVIQSICILQNTALYLVLGELTRSQPKPGQLFNS